MSNCCTGCCDCNCHDVAVARAQRQDRRKEVWGWLEALGATSRHGGYYKRGTTHWSHRNWFAVL
ncbi:unnamed protein product, partial [marine sediment metagenome]